MILKRIKEEKLVGVFREEEKIIEDTLRASYEGGLSVYELTLSIPNIAKWIAYAKEEYRDCVIGAGTVLTREDAITVIRAGASFVVSPVFSRDTYEICKDNGVLYIPGVMTLQEMFDARNKGCKYLKLFPSNVLGAKYLKDALSLFKDFEIMPTGGINEDNARSWIDAGAFGIGIGGEINKLAINGNFDGITKMIKNLKTIVG